MKNFKIQLTPHGSKRLFLYRNAIPENPTQRTMLFTSFDIFSIWNSTDLNNEEYISWEFDEDISDETIINALKKCNCYLK